MMRRRLAGLAGTVLVAALAAAGCGSSGAAPVTRSAGGAGAASGSLQGKTVSLVVGAGPGGTFDLEARALAPALAAALHATVHVVNMPGGGGLKGWDYVAKAKPDGLTIGIGNLQGMVANVWEKVPGQNFNPAKLTWLGGYAGNRGLTMKAMFTNQTKPPFDSVADLIHAKKKVIELGSVGDVTGPLFFTIYKVPYEDLTSYADSAAQKAGMLRGDGQVDVKSYPGWASLVQSGQEHALFAASMRAKWSVMPQVPTIGTFMKQHPPLAPGGAQAMKADASALDAGRGIDGPPGMPAAIVTTLRQALAAAFQSSEFKSLAKKSRLAPYYLSPKAELAAVGIGLESSTVKLMRTYLPMSNGEAS